MDNTQGSTADKESQAYRITGGMMGAIFVILIGMVAVCFCVCLCYMCFKILWSQNSSTWTGSFNDLIQTDTDISPHGKVNQPHPGPQLIGEVKPALANQLDISVETINKNEVEEPQGYDRRTMNSVFEPDPNTSADSTHSTPDTSILQCTCQVSPTTQNYRQISDTIPYISYSEQSDIQEFRHAPRPFTSQNISRVSKSTTNYNILPLTVLPENHNKVSDFTHPQNLSHVRLPTIPEHPPSITPNTTRTLSSEIIQNPSSLPDLFAPSTSSMPDLAPSTRYAPYFLSGNSRLLYHRNTNIDMCDIQNSNSELEGISMSSIDSNESLASIQSPDLKQVMEEGNNYDDSAKI